MVKQFRSCKNSPSTQAGHHPFCSFALLPCSERTWLYYHPAAPLADDHISRKTIAAATATYSQEECSFMQATSFFANVRHHSCTYFTSFQGEFVFRLDHTTLGISERKKEIPFRLTGSYVLAGARYSTWFSMRLLYCTESTSS